MPGQRPSERRLAVLASGRGSNLAAIADGCEGGVIAARLSLVLCNRPDAGALRLAKERGIEVRLIDHRAFDSRAAFDEALLGALAQAAIDTVVLAGFMRVLGDAFVTHYEGALFNIHPSLLPRYPGLHTHRRAIEAGDREGGATVHFVIPELDAGPSILRSRVPILPDDDEQSLAQRVLREEHRIYPLALSWFAAGRLRLREGKAWLDDEAISDGGGLWLQDLESAQAPPGAHQARGRVTPV